MPSPTIDYSFSVNISPAGAVTIGGKDDGFPSYLGTVSDESGRKLIFENSSEDEGVGGPLRLFPWIGDRKVSEECQFGGVNRCTALPTTTLESGAW